MPHAPLHALAATATEPEVQIRPAGLLDVPKIYALLKQYSEQGILLARSENDLYAALREFYVIQDLAENQLAACSALQIFSNDLGEVRSLAVAPAYQKHGLGRRLLRELEQAARTIGLKRLMALTYEVDFFTRNDYHVVDMRALPEKVWGVCINCHKFRRCDEIAVLKYL